jgi:ribosomal protein S18 acetylase RimI-like enzyme
MGPERRDHRVVDATPDRDVALGASLARAFWDDPVMAFLVPGERHRFARLSLLYRQDLREGRRRGRALTTEAGGAVAIWYPPGRWASGPLDMVRAAPSGLRGIGPTRLPRALGTLAAMERAHPAEPHWYLALLGSEPAHRGTGAAAALLDEVLGRCDAEGTPAYLESSKEENLAYYRRFGFEVTGEIPLPGAGPPLWPMWRGARA